MDNATILDLIRSRGPEGSFTFGTQHSAGAAARDFRDWAKEQGVAVEIIRNTTGRIVRLVAAPESR